MTTNNFVIHRGNSPANKSSATEQVKYYIDAGYRKIEVDIYAISESSYKFCHPLDKDRVTEVHDLQDGFLNNFVNKYPSIEWFVDLKCLDLDNAPTAMMKYLCDVFGVSALFTAAQPEILEFINHIGMRTAQYFKDDIETQLSYEPDFYVQNTSDNLRYPNEKTIIYSSTIDKASECLNKGFADVMIDGYLLIDLK